MSRAVALWASPGGAAVAAADSRDRFFSERREELFLWVKSQTNRDN
jgi:hypothetical protein